MTEENSKVENVLKAYHDAVLIKDIQGMLNLYSRDVRVFDTWEKWEMNHSAWQEAVEGWFGFTKEGHDKAQLEEVQIRISGEMALVTAFVVYMSETATNQRVQSIKNRITMVLAREDGEWKILHEHTSVPLSMESMKGIFVE